MAQQAETIESFDITHAAELRRLAEEVRDRQESRMLRAEDEDVAILVPVPRRRRRGEGVEDRAAFDAVMAAAGGWRGIVDTEQLKEDIKAARGSDRPVAEFWAVPYLLDSDWVIDHLAGRADAVALVARLWSDGISISLMTYLEVYEGILGGRDTRAAERVFQEFLEGIEVIGVNRAIARRTAELRVDLRRRRLPISHRALDLIIAATAIEQDLALVSRNTRDYEDIGGLRIFGRAT